MSASVSLFLFSMHGQVHAFVAIQLLASTPGIVPRETSKVHFNFLVDVNVQAERNFTIQIKQNFNDFT